MPERKQEDAGKEEVRTQQRNMHSNILFSLEREQRRYSANQSEFRKSNLQKTISWTLHNVSYARNTSLMPNTTKISIHG